MLLSEGSAAAGTLSMVLMLLVWVLIYGFIILIAVKLFKKLFRFLDLANKYLELKINDKDINIYFDFCFIF